MHKRETVTKENQRSQREREKKKVITVKTQTREKTTEKGQMLMLW